ncbi:MAG: sulfite dehydrogenase, partial [Pseudomonadota bacterium]|nr:sulfite dehydrogenase [Pseudomonadota bacterium]
MSRFIDRRAALERGFALALALPATTAFAAGDPPGASPGSAPKAAGAPEGPLPAGQSTATAGQGFSNYGQPSRHERRVIRLVGANPAVPGNGVSWTPLESLEGVVTPSGLHFERHHNGVPAIDPGAFAFRLGGLVQRALRFDLAALLRYPRVSRLLFLECGGNSNAGWHQEPIQKPVGSFHGLVSCSEWTGIPLRCLLDEAGVDARARWGIASGLDAAATEVSVPLAKLRDDAMLALFQNGERLRPENGYPLRLILPGWEGVTQIKWLQSIELTDRPLMSRNETAQYTDLLPDGRARQFSFVMAPKSLITSPSHGMHLPAPAIYEVQGLAWSGHGSVAAVEVSDDGGRSWWPARLETPVLPQCFTR